MKTKTFLLLLLVLSAIFGVVAPRVLQSQKTATTKSDKTAKIVASGPCDEIDAKTIIVSIGQRHLWACEDGKVAYDSAVVTGDMNNPENLTPTGSYQIYAKQTDRTLSGSDTKGKWDVHVNYWMPFLHNQYGSYGFHDATWRDNDEFGNVDPYSSAASHGCVELPLMASKWLYDWSAVGTQVVVQA